MKNLFRYLWQITSHILDILYANVKYIFLAGINQQQLHHLCKLYSYTLVFKDKGKLLLIE